MGQDFVEIWLGWTSRSPHSVLCVSSSWGWGQNCSAWIINCLDLHCWIWTENCRQYIFFDDRWGVLTWTSFPLSWQAWLSRRFHSITALTVNCQVYFHFEDYRQDNSDLSPVRVHLKLPDLLSLSTLRQQCQPLSTYNCPETGTERRGRWSSPIVSCPRLSVWIQQSDEFIADLEKQSEPSENYFEMSTIVPRFCWYDRYEHNI